MADGEGKSAGEDFKYSDSLETTIKEVVKGLDTLDDANFDPIKYINELFPDERSLTYAQGEPDSKKRPNQRLDSRLSKLRRDMVVVSEGISKSVRQHSCQRVQTKKAIGDAQTSIEALFNNIKAIKAKAETSEKMVQEICRDIKSLDYAKIHLTSTISSLMKLHMLNQAVDMLVYMSEKKQYKEVANRLGAVDMLFLDFENYQHIPKIAELKKIMLKERAKLQKQILGEFHTYGPNPSVGLDDMVAMLREGCLVIQALGVKAKEDLLIWFSRSKLGPYSGLFGPGKPAGVLNQTDRRYAWLRRTLREYEEHFKSIFPASWCVPAVLSRDFCLLTRDHLRGILKGSKDTDINALVSALTKTIAFEQELQMKFGDVDDEVKDNVNAISNGVGMDSNSIKQRYREGKKETFTGVKMNFKKMISSVFNPYLGQYVQLERENIATLLTKITQEEKWGWDEKEGRRCLGCSEKVFIYIKKSLRRCSRLATGQVLLEIAGEYRKGLGDFCAMLKSHLPAQSQNKDPQLSKSDNLAICTIANTAEECKEIIPGIAEAIQKVIDDKFQEQIDFSEEQAQFSALVNHSLETVVRGFCVRLGKILGLMVKMPLANWESVGDQSEYVNQMNSMFTQYIPPISKMLSDAYHMFFCNKLAQRCIPLYEEHIFKCKKVNALGAQQLALDSHAIKTIFLAIPKFRGEISERRTRSFQRIVDREMGKVVAIVKTLASQNDCLIATFKTLLPRSMAASSSETLTKILYLKGLKKNEQQALVDSYNGSVEKKEQVALDTKTEGLKKFFKFGST